MIPEQISYPSFEANQVLSSVHLNDLFNFLDEQDRLTRTNLIGIGIVCGLEPTIAATGNSIQISKGCGITSEGHIIVWEDAAALEWAQPYEMPLALPYREFENRLFNPPQPFPIWELAADRNNDDTAFRLSSDFLTGNNQPAGREDEKILVLFLECLAENNRNCVPNSCNDKGTTVTATVRPLLIRRRDIDLLQARIAALGPEAQAYFTLANSANIRSGLPTLKLPRFDVSATTLGSTTSVFTAFQRVINTPLVSSIVNALSAAYSAFRPLLPGYPTNPFSNLSAQWRFLHDGSIESDNLYLWYQYFYDHLDTVIQAYDEFRLKGMDLLGLCCPDKRLFPRHLMLGNVGVTPVNYTYRHTFVPSPVHSNQSGEMEELRLLFQRLVELIAALELPPNINSFTFDRFNNTFVREFPRANRFSRPIRITPSHLARPLSQKAIPYHYRPVPLYEYWSFHKNKQGKANENLGYRSPNWDDGIPFIRFPLRYELEPHNFFRIEGHIGRNFQDVLSELLRQKEANRLPIDIVAVKTGYNEDTIPLPGEIDECHFQDLESLYKAFREELLCQICELLKHLYNLPYPPNSEPRTLVAQAPRLTILTRCAPDFRYYTDTIGQYYENRRILFRTDFRRTFSAFFFVPGFVNFTLNIIPSLNNLALSLSETLRDFDFDNFQSLYSGLLDTIEPVNFNLIFARNDADDESNADALDLEELSDQLDHFLYACKLDAIRGITNEYEQRIERLKEQLLLSHFARKHDGLQHKAGVPPGGTFVLVYHGEDQQDRIPTQPGFFTIRGQVVADGRPMPGVNVLVASSALGTQTDFDGNFVLQRVRLPAQLRVAMVSFPSLQVLVTSTSPVTIDLSAPPSNGNPSGRFTDLAVGAIIADFYLPYLCCSDCTPIQFVLPKVPPTFLWEQEGCTDPNGNGMIRITASGGTAPYEYSTDSGQNWISLGEEAIAMADETQIQIRDAEGTVSIRRTVELIPPLSVDPIGRGECNPEGTAFSLDIAIIGGRPPYTVTANGSSSAVPAGQNGTVTFPSGEGGEVLIADSSDPACEQRIQVEPITCPPPCGLPCNGITRDVGYPFWMQRNVGEQVFIEVQLEVTNFQVFTESGETLTVDPAQLTERLNPSRNLTLRNFTRTWSSRVNNANDFIQEELSPQLGIEDPVLRLQFVQNARPNLTELRIEHFECHRFDFTMELRFLSDRRNSRPFYRRSVNYTQDGMTFTEIVENIDNPISNSGFLPAFNAIIRDRCNPDVPERALCQETLETRVISDPGRFSVFLATRGTENLPTLWILEHGVPAMVLDDNIRSSILENTQYEATVIVVDPDTTCAAIVNSPIFLSVIQ